MSCRFAFAALLCFCAALGMGAEKDVEQLLANMRKAYQSVKSAKVVTEAKRTNQAGMSRVTTTELSFLGPKKVLAKVKTEGASGSNASILVTDGKTVRTTGFPGDDLEDPYNLDVFTRILPVNLETINFWDWKRQLSTSAKGNMHTSKLKIVRSEAWNGKKWWVLEETAEAQKLFVRYYVDPKANLIWRTVAMDLEKKRTLIDAKVTKLELNPKLDAKIFDSQWSK